MGGYAALLLESRAPGSLGGIVTLGTKFEWTPESAMRESARLDPAVLSAKVPKFAETLAERHAGSGGWELLLQRTATLLQDLGATPLLTEDSLRRVRVPVIVAVGSRDDTVNAAEAARVASLMHDATSIGLPDAPHPIERVRMEHVANLVREVLDRAG
jgi:pimeloyl-ACP methyl ester carboxylesterase